MKRIAVLSRSLSRHAILRAELASRYADVRFNDGAATLTDSKLVEFLRDCDAAIVALESITPTLLDAVPQVRVISKYGVGCDNIDLHACAARGIRVGWTGGVNRRSVAELTIAFMIATLRNIAAATELVRAGDWQQVRGRELGGRRVGIIGLGNVGQDVVRLLQPFRCHIFGNDIRDVSAFATAHNVTLTSLDAVVAQAEILSLHMPLTRRTSQMINHALIAQMTQGIILINTARGGIIDETALLEALTSGKVGAAALDVSQVEPPTDLKLARLTNVIATPHIGGSTEEAILAMGRAAIAGLETAGDPLLLIVEA